MWIRIQEAYLYADLDPKHWNLHLCQLILLSHSNTNILLTGTYNFITPNYQHPITLKYFLVISPSTYTHSQRATSSYRWYLYCRSVLYGTYRTNNHHSCYSFNTTITGRYSLKTKYPHILKNGLTINHPDLQVPGM